MQVKQNNTITKQYSKQSKTGNQNGSNKQLQQNNSQYKQTNKPKSVSKHQQIQSKADIYQKQATPKWNPQTPTQSNNSKHKTHLHTIKQTKNTKSKQVTPTKQHPKLIQLIVNTSNIRTQHNKNQQRVANNPTNQSQNNNPSKTNKTQFQNKQNKQLPNK